MRTLWFVAVLACFARLGGTPAAAAPSPALPGSSSTASCPSVLFIESTNGKYYIAVFESHAPTKTAIDLTFYTKSAVYATTLAEVMISKPVDAKITAYRSPPAVIRNPGTDEFLGAAVTPHAAPATCPGGNIIIPSVATLTDPDRHIDPQTDALEADLATEAAGVTNITTPTPVSGVPVPSCAVPFADASVDQLVKPDLTPEQRKDQGLFPVDVRVQLDATGAVRSTSLETSSGSPAVDAAVIDAANRTTFHPARFACQSESSSHVIHVDFTAKS